MDDRQVEHGNLNRILTHRYKLLLAAQVVLPLAFFVQLFVLFFQLRCLLTELFCLLQQLEECPLSVVTLAEL